MSSPSTPREISAAVRIEHFQKAKVLRRLFALAVFVAALVAFRQLALLGVTFVIFSRAFGAAGARLTQAATRRFNERSGVALVLHLFVLLLAGVIWAAVLAGVRHWSSFRLLHDGEPLIQVMTQTFAELQDALMRRLPAWVPL